MPKVIVAHSSECHEYLETKDISVLADKKSIMINGYKIKKGYDWDVYNFQTDAECKAFVMGLESQSGWISDPEWSIIN
jgi:hypothetical protein